MEHGPDRRAVLLQPAEEGGERLAVGGVARGHGDAGAERAELGLELGGAGCLGAAAAGEHEVLGAVSREPARQVRAKRPRAAGHEHGPAGPPGTHRGLGAQRRSQEAADVQPVGADRELVLVAGAADDGREPREGPRVEWPADVDEASPARRGARGRTRARRPRSALATGG